MEECFQGKDKYTRLQVNWMDSLHCAQHDVEKAGNVGRCWQKLFQKTELNPEADVKSVILSCVGRAVFHFCQKTIVNIKEGDEVSEEEEDETNCLQDSRFIDDEASLYRLGGFALKAVIQACPAPEMSTVLSLMKMSLEEKVLSDLPSNIQHLDKGGMTFMKKEFLGYLAL